MKYNIHTLRQEFDAQKPLEYLFFWGHRYEKDGSVGKGCLSQWWESNFTVDAISYPSAEHWMMAEKARLFKDGDMLNQIINCTSPAQAKKLGRKVENFDAKVWDEHKFEIVKKGNLHKFGQNETLKTFLLRTQNLILVEASPYDKIWGIGMKKGDANIDNPHYWKGDNLLGFALMEVRDEL